MADGTLTFSELEDRHRHPRYSVLIKAVLQVGDEAIDCDVINLSAGGAKVRLVQSLTVGAPVVLNVEGTLRFEGNIAWQTGENAGIEFAKTARMAEQEAVEIVDGAEDVRERRTATRKSVVWLADLYVGIRRYTCKILNISAGGAKLALDADLQPGTAISLRSRNFGEFKAQVVWRQGGYVGVRFEDEDPAEQDPRD